ncbi:MAG: ABC transporter permease [candidate division WOR-3 bacterium]|nr:ABC transporter permease [candidate division WOR-3 bacterium]
MLVELFVAFRYMRSRHRKFLSFSTMIAIGGIFVGVSALLITLSIMNGFQNELRRRILGGTPHIIVRRFFNEPMDNYRDVMDKLEGLPFIKAKAPFIITKSLVRNRKNVDGVVIRGVIPELEKNITEVSTHMIDGTFDLDNGCVIGIELAQNLKASVGDTIIVTSPFTEQIGLLPRSKRLILKGIFDLGVYDYNATVVYMNMKDVQKLFETGDAVSGVQIKVDDVYKTPVYSKIIEERIGYPFRVQDWIELNHSVFAALKLEKIVTFIVLTLIIIVAGFNIVGTLINIVKKKTKEIGILRSYGFTKTQIMKIFIYLGSIMGIIGTISGIIFSVISCYFLNRYQFVTLPGDVYFIQTLPVEMSLNDFLAVAIASILISFLATIYPALRAASLVTVDALRNE